MDYRGVLLVGMLSGATILGATSACSGPDPGAVTFIERPRGAGGELSSGGSSGTSGDTTDGGTAEGGTDGGSSGAGDPVFGTSTFAAGNPGRSAPAKGKTEHAAFPQSDPAGQDCIVAGCHQGGWAFGGTLYTDATGTTRVPGAEIRISGPDGKEFAKTFSDPDGNFWLDYVSPIPTNSRVGVRTADGKKLNMVGTVGAGQAGCSQAGTCHGGTQGKVYIK